MEWLYLLHGTARDYAWGNPEPESLIARLLRSNQTQTGPGPWAELWMGDHATGPSPLKNRAGDLRSLRAAAGRPELPFLFKILDASQALSIQTHPDKSLAEQLHNSDPQNYPDKNHKPEIAICLSGFKALSGFRPLEQINEFLRRLRPFQQLSGLSSLGKPEDLGMLLRSILSQPAEIVREAVDDLLGRGRLQGAPFLPQLQKAADTFGPDPGLFAFLYLNYIELQPGEALFAGPGLLHAYLEGQIVECMANSDNVIRAGLTGKKKDVPALLAALRFDPGPPEILPAADLYRPPVAEFEIERIRENTVQPGRPAIGIVIQGALEIEDPRSRTVLSAGNIYYLAEDRPELTLRSSGLTYQAIPNGAF
ncbi:MAG: mannose-6-phosphate isomerase, class I [Spirochaetales bacterium]|nr:mannose-6-phosphate isomerase, class I [Spirochaetales bacterium]